MPKLISYDKRQAVWADIVANLPISQIASKQGVSREFVRKCKMRQLSYEKLNPNLYRLALAVKVLGFHNIEKCVHFGKKGYCSLLSESLNFVKLRTVLGEEYNTLIFISDPDASPPYGEGGSSDKNIKPWPELCAICGNPTTARQLRLQLERCGFKFA